MIWIIIEEALVLTRMALTAQRVINGANTIAEWISPEAATELAKAKVEEEEELLFYILAGAIHEQLCSVAPELIGHKDLFYDAADKALDTDAYESADDYTSSKVSAFVRELGRVMSDDQPGWMEYFDKYAATLALTGNVPTDIIRFAITQPGAADDIIKDLSSKDSYNYDAKEIKAVIEALEMDTNYDASTRFTEIQFGATIMFHFLALFPTVDHTSEFGTKNIIINASYVTHPDGTMIKGRQQSAKRYQTRSITRQFQNDIEREMGKKSKLNATELLSTSGEMATEEAKKFQETLKLAAEAQVARQFQRILNRINKRGAAYARAKFGRSAGQIAQTILEGKTLKRLSK